MRLRLALLSLKFRASKFIYLLFCLTLALVAHLAINKVSSQILGINLGFIVWILAGFYLRLVISAQRERADDMSSDNDAFFDLREFKNYVEQMSDTVLKLKYLRFVAALEDVVKRSGVSWESFPSVFVAAPKSDPDEAKEAKLLIYHTGLDKGSVIGVSAESIFADDVTQKTMSYILAHELGHFLSGSILSMTIIESIGQTARGIFRLIFGGLFFYNLFMGEWATAITSLMILFFLLTLAGVIRNTMVRYEEYHADSYAISLGYGEEGVNFFDYMIENKIAHFPSFMEVFVDHPSHENRRQNNWNLHTNNQGLILDSTEQLAYFFFAALFAVALYLVTPDPEVPGVLLTYFWLLGLLVSLATPGFTTPSLLQRSVKFLNWLLSIGVLVTVILTLGLTNEVPIVFIVLSSALFLGQIALPKNAYFKAIFEQVEVGLVLTALLLLAHALHFINIPVLLQSSLL